MLLVVGTAVSQLLPLAVQPYLRRVFSVEEFGLFSQYFSIVSIVAIVAGLKYDASIMIPRSDRVSRHLLAGAVFFNLCTAFLFLIILFLVGHYALGATGLSEELANYFWLMPISVFFIATNVAINYWLTRKKRFKGIVVNKVSRRTAEEASRVGLGANGIQGGILYGSVIGDFVNLIVSLVQYRNSGGTFKMMRRKQIITELKAQIEFPKYSLLPNVLNTVSSKIPIFLVAIFYGDFISGQFDGSIKLLAAPLGLISISLSQVLYQRIVDDVNNDRKILRFIRNNIFFLGGLGLLLVLIVIPFGIEVFTWYYGDDYLLSGEISQLLVLSYAIKFMVSPLSFTLVALKKLKVLAIWQIAYFILTIGLFWVGHLSIYDFILCLVIIDLVAYLVYGILIISAARKQDLKVDALSKN